MMTTFPFTIIIVGFVRLVGKTHESAINLYKFVAYFFYTEKLNFSERHINHDRETDSEGHEDIFG